MQLPLRELCSYICFAWGQARLLGTLSVSRGLGDHQLKVIDTNIEVKPFLSCIPKVSRNTWNCRGVVEFSCSYFVATKQVSAMPFFHPILSACCPGGNEGT